MRDAFIVQHVFEGLQLAACFEGRQLIALFADHAGLNLGDQYGAKILRPIAGSDQMLLALDPKGTEAFVRKIKNMKAGNLIAVEVKALPQKGKLAEVSKLPQAVKNIGRIQKGDDAIARAKNFMGAARIIDDPDAAEIEWLTDALSVLREEKISLKPHGTITIQQTEAAVIMDVDSDGGNALAVNLAAAVRAAREIELRQLSGIILIDFLRCDSKGRFAIIKKMKENFRLAPKPDILGFSRAGLLELTRARGAKPFAEWF